MLEIEVTKMDKKTKALVAMIFGSAMGGCGTFEGWPTLVDYWKYCRNVENIPKDWTWEPEGNYYRSPDGKKIWHNGEILPSLEKDDSDIEMHEVLRRGDYRYSPAYIRGEHDAARIEDRIHTEHAWQPRHYNTRQRR